MNKPRKYFTTGDIARYCEVDVNTVKNWIKHGQLQAFTTPSGHYRIARDAFINFINKQGFIYEAEFFGEDSNGPDVLIIDDDTKHGDRIVYTLNSHYQNLKFEVVSNGFDGYTRLQDSQPKIVLLDLVMNGINGLEFLRIIRSNERMKHIRVVVLSAHTTEKFNKELKELGVVDILEKPVDKNRLLDTMDAYLSNTIPNVIHN